MLKYEMQNIFFMPAYMSKQLIKFDKFGDHIFMSKIVWNHKHFCFFQIFYRCWQWIFSFFRTSSPGSHFWPKNAYYLLKFFQNIHCESASKCFLYTFWPSWDHSGSLGPKNSPTKHQKVSKTSPNFRISRNNWIFPQCQDLIGFLGHW